MRIRTLVVCALVSGCAGRYHTEFVGHGTAFVQPRTEVAASSEAAVEPAQSDDIAERSRAPWAVGRGIQLAAGTYRLALVFEVPRAQEVEWTISCPGAQQSGIVGESLQRYRERRIAELRADVARDRQRTAAVTSAIVGAFAPRITAEGTAGPLTVRGDVGPDANAVGAAVAEHAVPLGVTLPAGDVGRGRFETDVQVTTTGSGVCVVTAIADDANVYGTYRVARVRDLEAEARAAAMAERSVALSTRTKLQARLVAHGADAEVRRREKRAAIEARYAAEATARAELEARMRVRAEQEEQWRILALHARAELRGRCEGHGADPQRRQRVAEEHRVAAEAQARLAADVEQRRLELAFHARSSLRDRWVRLGAIARPPMPEPLAEEPGAPPFVGAVWLRGHWTWIDGRWTWVPGGWADSYMAGGEAGDSEIVEDGGAVIDDPIIDLGFGVGAGQGAAREQVRDHRRAKPERERLRDHRSPTRSSNIRDHRSREHREVFTPSRSEPPPARNYNSDKRDGDKRDDDKKDDRGSMIRDHRR